METTVRLRLEFDSILSESQKAEELKLCWILLKPEHKTISDFASYLLRVFDLHNACPGGLLLSMEGFVLPPFESTFIFKDKDIVRVKKRVGTSSEVVPNGDGLNLLDVVEIVDHSQVATGMQLLTNEEFDKESGGYESESEEGQPGEAEASVEEEEPAEVLTESKKRKRKDSKEKQRSKRKKSKCGGAEKSVAVFENGHGGNNVCREHDKNLSTLKTDQRNDKSGKATTSANGSCHPQENGKGIMDAPIVPITKKISRSSRRKQVNRQRLRERTKAEKKQQNQRQLLEKTNQQSSEKDNHQVAEQSNDDVGHKISEGPEKSNEVKVDQEQPDQGSDMDDDVIPVVIRPGHIRYESRKKVAADQTVQQNQISVETFRWIGVTNKKRGQKWGTEKPMPHKRIDCRNDYVNLNQEFSRMPIIEEKPVYEHIDFDKLSPYVSSPKEGDVIAYRLIELSSSWTPEVSSYRVGKISWYDAHSSRITLMPVPGYPVIPQKVDDEESTMLPETSLYADDGSLEIDFISLLEVRTVTCGNLNSAKSFADGAETIHVRDENARTDLGGPNTNNASHASARESGELNPWEEINKALDAKKAQLCQEDNWNRAESSGRRSWSNKALRGSALGPTMALLRPQNGP